MTSPVVLAPATPSELITHILDCHRHPTTLLIASPKQPFLNALAHEVRLQGEPHQLLHKSILQTAISRHIRVVFIPTVTHLRAYLATFSRGNTKVPAPPDQRATNSDRPPLLLVYGFLEAHRLTSEWSAQGIANSASALVEAAARNAFRAAVVEPRGGGGGLESLDEFMGERVPLINATLMRESGAWSGRQIEIHRVVGRWFETRPQERQ